MKAGPGIVFKENNHVDNGPVYVDPASLDNPQAKKYSRIEYEKMYSGKNYYATRQDMI